MNLAAHPGPPPASPSAVESTTPTTPLPRCEVCPLLADNLELRQQAGYWKSMHQRAGTRLTELQAELEHVRAQLRLRERQLFGRKAEPAPAHPPDQATLLPSPEPPRPCGQQRGRPSPPRRDYSHLPVVLQELELPAGQQQCPHCGQPFAAFPGTADSELLEIEVRAYRRRYRRHRYRPTCRCGCQPGLVTAPGPAKLIPKSQLGVSVWVTVLLDKFAFGRPTQRLLADLASHGLDLSAGTLTDGLQRLVPLFEPLYEAWVAKSRQMDHWHADETRWLVFVSLPDKSGHRWYLWAFQSEAVVVFVLDPGRAHDVPEEHLGSAATGILSVDRYSAYKALPQVKNGRILLAFCWAHQRRDFLGAAAAWPTEQQWALGWVTAIGELYHLNDRRLEVREDSEAFQQRDQDLRVAVAAFQQRWEAEGAEPQLHPARRKTLSSLRDHWPGLTLFVEHPEIPMDNNTVERTLREPVVGRKNYAGSRALWSGQLLVQMLSLLATLKLWGLNPRLWLTAYLEACAQAAGRVPAEASRWLPWNLSQEQQRAWASEPAAQDST
jgi:transposase